MRVEVHPAVGGVEPLGKGRTVISSKRFEGGEDVGAGLGKGHLDRDAFDDRDIEVIEVNVLEPERLLSQLDVAVEQRQVGVDGRHQIVVDRGVDVVLVQVSLEGGFVATGAGIVDVELELAGQCRGERVLVLAKGAEEGRDSTAPDFAIVRTRDTGRSWPG